MQKIEDFLNSKDTYNKVMTALSHYSSGGLTQIGGINQHFIAGGSVSNILVSIFHGDRKQCVVNDIDIYRQVTEDDTQHQRAQWYPSLYVTEEGLEMYDDNYGRVFVCENGSRMRVTKHSRKGIFNIVEYLYYPKMHSTKSKELVILEGFDLNCCKSGIDMTNQKIVYTQEFVEFLKTKELKITNPCAPIQTTLRLHKKMKELDCTCNIEQEMRFLTVATRHITSNQMTKYIGPETYRKYVGMQSVVDKYFTLRKPSTGELPKEMPNKNLIWVFDPIMDFDIIENVGTINNLKRVWELLYTIKDVESQDKINKIFYKNVFLGNMDEDTWSKYEYDPEWGFNDTDNEPKIIPYYNSDRYTYQMLLMNKNYHKCDFNLHHVDFIDKFAFKYYDLRILLKGCETLIEQYELAVFIDSLYKTEGDWMTDFLGSIRFHSFTYNKLFGYEDLLTPKNITKENILRVVKIEKKFLQIRCLIKTQINRIPFINN